MWHCGKQILSVIDTVSLKSMYIISEYTPNTIVRKLLGMKRSNAVVILEVFDEAGKNQTWINSIDVETRSRLVFSKSAEEVNQFGKHDLSVHRYTKSIEVSVEEDVLFTVGVYVDGIPDKPVQRGFINAMRFNKTLDELAFALITEASHAEKKGMYRVSRCAKDNTLVVGAWTDVFVLLYEPKGFSHLHSFHNLHSSFIYNVIAFDRCFFTCSNDCDASLIEF